MHRLILVTNRKLASRSLEGQIERLLKPWAAGEREVLPTWLGEAEEISVLLREPDLAPKEYAALGVKVQDIAAFYGAKFLSHGAPENGRLLSSEHHLPLRFAEGWKSQDLRIVGTSIHSEEQRSLLLSYRPQGITYAMLSPIFATDCKPGVQPLGAEVFKSFPRISGCYYYALGGIGERNFREPLKNGADGIAVMGTAMRW